MNLPKLFSRNRKGDRSDLYIQATRQLYQKNVELLKEKKKERFLLDNAVEAVINCDDQFKIQLINVATERLLSKKQEEILGKNLLDHFKLFTRDEDEIGIDEILKTKKFVPGNYLILKTNERKYFIYLSLSTISLESERTEYIISIRDVTSEKQIEQAKDDFISVTSHELRTPMTIIKSYLWMLSAGKGGVLTEKQKEYVQKAARATERMLDLINDTLNISKIEQGAIDIKTEQIDLRDYIKDALADFVVKTEEKHLSFNINIAQDISVIYADKNKLREVLINLVGNSLKFTGTGGITVKAEKLNDDFVKISVIDTGRGLEKEEIEKLFHKFGRLDNSYQTVAEAGGTGLGLYIVKQLVENMGGNVGVESPGKDKGSTFWITLPASHKQEEEVKSKIKADHSPIY